MYAAVFLLNLGVGMVLPILPIYARSYGASMTVIGLMGSAVAAGQLALQLPAGYMADRFGDRPVAASGLALFVPALLGLAALPGPPAFVLLRLLEGCAVGIATPALYAIVSTRCPPGRAGTALGLFTFSAASGLAVAPGLGGMLAARIGPRLLFPLVAVGAALATTIVLTSAGAPVRGGLEREGRRAAGGLLAVLRSLGAAVAVALVPAAAFSAVARLAFSALVTVFPLYASDSLGLSSDALGLVFTMNFVLFSLGQPVAGRISDRLAGHRDLLVSGLVMGGAFALLAVADSLVTFTALLAVEAFAASWVVVSSRRLVAGAADVLGPAKAFALLGVSSDSASFVGPLLAAAAYGAGSGLPFLLVGAASCLALLISLPAAHRFWRGTA